MAVLAGKKVVLIVSLLTKHNNLKNGVGHTDELMWGTSANRCAPHRFIGFIDIDCMLLEKKQKLYMKELENKVKGC